MIDTVNKVEVGRSIQSALRASRLVITADNNILCLPSDNISPLNIRRFDVTTNIPVLTGSTPNGPVLDKTLAQSDQVLHHRSTLLGRSSRRFQTGNELTAIMNQAGDPDCLLSLVPYGRNHWLAGERPPFQGDLSHFDYQFIS